VIGDRRPHNVALIVLDPAAAAFAVRRGLDDLSFAALTRDGDLLAEIARAVERANLRFSRPEQIRRFRVLDTDWEAAGDELTPTLKLRRVPIQHKYPGEIASLYAEDAQLSASR
jgi:long-chain acyl-CoA synthetase